ncbi:MAG: pilus assembly protein [Burkholderiaceae bacterium]|jgi:hypothetical protein|nr:pilus assembly protein [Burkholderiaceae bacterium]
MSRSRQPAKGQATAEFLVALLAIVPLFMGVYYFARYADVKHSAIQASRYVAFERSWDPYNRAKTPVQLAEEARTRFFMSGSRNKGEIRYRDSTVDQNNKGLDTADAANRVPLWSDLGYQPLLARYADVQITESDAGKLNTGTIGKLQELGAPVFNLPKSGIMKAEVTVPLSNIVNYDALSKINIGLPGATAMGSGVWNASGAKGGSESVCDRVTHWAVVGEIIKPVAQVLGTLMSPIFEKNAPDFGIVQPDYDIPGSVRDGSGNNVPYLLQQGNKC